ncbi:hypothetical protein LCGC14_0702850 [marine sediment metagenome]|uniref:Uncharacterized protein n=1 Tax=marine sediment metagenome TaxID=412755 RepID=A0A0F9QH98_9ZZZZ
MRRRYSPSCLCNLGCLCGSDNQGVHLGRARTRRVGNLPLRPVRKRYYLTCDNQILAGGRRSSIHVRYPDVRRETSRTHPCGKSLPATTAHALPPAPIATTIPAPTAQSAAFRRPAPDGAKVRSPGREPWVNDVKRNIAPEGRKIATPLVRSRCLPTYVGRLLAPTPAENPFPR